MNFKFSLYKNWTLYIPLFVSMALVYIEMPAWAQATAVLALSWRALIEWKSLAIPSNKIFTVLVLFLVVMTAVEFRTLLGRDAASVLFFVLLPLKILESKGLRDQQFVWLLILGIINLHFLYSIEIYLMPLAIASLLLVFLDILRVYSNNSHKINLLFILKGFAYSLPLAALLFLFFPRTQSPWGMSRQVNSESGFSDELSASDAADITLNDDLAFRARFLQTNTVRSSELYWIGSRLYKSDGLDWRRQFISQQRISSGSNAENYQYEVYLEPHRRQWIFTLAGTESIVTDGYDVSKRIDGVFRYNGILTSALSYKGIFSNNRHQAVAMEDLDLLQLPELSSTFQNWVQSYFSESTNVEEKIERLIQFYSTEKFQYTLQPGDESTNLEQFLFDSKKGFCQHFAGSAATILRSLGIPSRVVVGYQGGVYNPFGEFWSILQRDAHAWVEYIDAQGMWRTLDPVQYVAPLRIQLGSLEYFRLPDNFKDAASINPREIPWFERAWDQAQFYMDNMNYQWILFMLDFNKSNQREILRAMLPNLGKVFVLLLAAFFLLSLLRQYAQYRKLPRHIRLLQRIEKIMSKQGHTREPNETPIQFIRRCRNFSKSPSGWDRIERFYIQEALQEKQGQWPAKDLRAIRS